MFSPSKLELKRLPWLKGNVAKLKEVIKQTVDRVLFDLILADRSLDAPVRLKVVENFDTACWAYTEAPATHNIVIGAGIINRARAGLGKEDLERLVEAYHRHESGHARHSPRSHKETRRRVLRPAGCEFPTYNAFEDARLEQLERAATGKRFGWSSLEEFDAAAAASSPHNLFLACIWVEGDRPLLERHLGASIPADLDNVWQYWERAAKCAAVEDLVPIIRDWISEYGDFPKAPAGCGLGTGLDINQNPELLDQLSEPEAKPDATADGEEARGGGSPMLAAFTMPLPYTQGELTHVVDMLRRQLRTREIRQSTHRVQKRLNHRAIASELPMYRQAKIEGAATRKKMAFLFDCSGSMDGQPRAAGVLFVAALSELAKQGLISGHVIFSKIDGQAMSEAFPLPLSEDTLQRIVCDGGAEGLQYAAMKHLSLLQEAEWVGCFTDANITDKPMDKQKLRRHGVYIHGLYVEPGMASKEAKLATRAALLRHFDMAVVAPTVRELLETLVIG